MRYLILVLACLFSMMTFSACSSDKEVKEEEEQSTKATIFEKVMGESLGGVDFDKLQENEPVNFREFDRFFPKRVDGFKKSDFGGETTGIMGFTVSKAEAKYTDDDKTVEVFVMDPGEASVATMAFAQWSTLTIDKEDANSIERTLTWKGMHAFEKLDKNSKSSEFIVIVADRFIVNTKSSDLDLDDLKEFMDDFDPGDLKNVD